MRRKTLLVLLIASLTPMSSIAQRTSPIPGCEKQELDPNDPRYFDKLLEESAKEAACLQKMLIAAGSPGGLKALTRQPRSMTAPPNPQAVDKGSLIARQDALWFPKATGNALVGYTALASAVGMNEVVHHCGRPLRHVEQKGSYITNTSGITVWMSLA